MPTEFSSLSLKEPHRLKDLPKSAVSINFKIAGGIKVGKNQLLSLLALSFTFGIRRFLFFAAVKKKKKKKKNEKKASDSSNQVRMKGKKKRAAKNQCRVR
ncbi:hypothetical protein AAC387_Pa06g0923 [Persea americana]